MTTKYFCPECSSQLQESEIGVGGDQTIPAVECTKRDFYKSIDMYVEYLDDC